MPESISIAMATYNGALYLREQLDSLIAQDLPPSEIVICDDGSTDETVAIAADYAVRSPIPIRIEINERNLGYRANFIRAASLCAGDLIAFCDQDDVWHSNKLSEVARRFERPDVLMVYHNAEVVDRDLRFCGTLALQRPAGEAIAPMTLPPWIVVLGLTITFRRRLLRLWPLWEYSLDAATPGARAAHDQWVCFLASSLGTTIYSDQRLLKYRQHGGNTMGRGPPVSVRGRAAFIVGFADMLDKHRRTVASRIASLERAAGLDPAWSEQAERAVAAYREFDRLLALQAVVYGGQGVLERWRSGAMLRRAGAYRKWGFSRPMLYKDMVAAIAGPRLLRWLHRRFARPMGRGQGECPAPCGPDIASISGYRF